MAALPFLFGFRETKKYFLSRWGHENIYFLKIVFEKGRRIDLWIEFYLYQVMEDVARPPIMSLSQQVHNLQ